jgi:hypothetical protein
MRLLKPNRCFSTPPFSVMLPSRAMLPCTRLTCHAAGAMPAPGLSHMPCSAIPPFPVLLSHCHLFTYSIPRMASCSRVGPGSTNKVRQYTMCAIRSATCVAGPAMLFVVGPATTCVAGSATLCVVGPAMPCAAWPAMSCVAGPATPCVARPAAPCVVGPASPCVVGHAIAWVFGPAMSCVAGPAMMLGVVGPVAATSRAGGAWAALLWQREGPEVSQQCHGQADATDATQEVASPEGLSVKGVGSGDAMPAMRGEHACSTMPGFESRMAWCRFVGDVQRVVASSAAGASKEGAALPPLCCSRLLDGPQDPKEGVGIVWWC